MTPSLICVYDLHHTKCLKVKPPIDQRLKSLQIECTGCNASCVWQTTQHLATRLSEDKSSKRQVKDHFSVKKTMTMIFFKKNYLQCL